MVATRTADHPIHPQYLERWSPRAFDGSDVSEAQLLIMLEAARWAPSAFNAQPWRFLYARRSSPDWEPFLSLLAPFNQSWAKDAGALLFIVSDSQMTSPHGDIKPSHSHSFDAGTAFGYLALEAHRTGFHAHGMAGIDFTTAREALNLPEAYRLECAVAIGRRGSAAALPELLRERETPSPRKPLAEIAFAGRLPALAP